MAPTSLVRRMTFVVGVASICAPSVVHGQVITLTEAVRAAESHDRSIHIAELDREKALREVDVARTRRYPIFSVTALGSQPLTQLGITLERGSLGVTHSMVPFPPRRRPWRAVTFWIHRLRQRATAADAAVKSVWESSSRRSASTEQPNKSAPSDKPSSTKCDVSTTASLRPRAAGQRFRRSRFPQAARSRDEPAGRSARRCRLTC